MAGNSMAGIQSARKTRVYSSRPVEERFQEKIDKSGGPDACWLWTAATDTDGYGLFTAHHKGKQWRAHVLAFVNANGFKPPMVCHSCDNRPCCNPAHLFAGDAKMNMRDRDAKKRQRRGTRCHSNKLSETDVAAIRARYTRGSGTLALAREFGVHRSRILKIAKGQSWKIDGYDKL